MPGKQRTGQQVGVCCVCRQSITPDERPWTEVTLTGYTVAWHTRCNAEKERRK